MNTLRSMQSGRTILFCLLFLTRGLAEIIPGWSILYGADPFPQVRKIEPPVDWNVASNAGLWVQATAEDWKQFQASLVQGPQLSEPPSPVVMNAVYRASFDGIGLTEGQFEWSIHRFQSTPGFVELGRSSLAVSQLKWKSGAAIHGTTPSGDWMLWSESEEEILNGQWTQRGEVKLDDVVFDFTLPRALSSQLEIRVPEGWEARILGVIGTEAIPIDTANRGIWKFELGRQQTVQLRMGRKPPVESPRILLRENTVYELTTTDDLIRMRCDLDCTIDGTRHSELLLSTPKTLRVFKVLLGNELPLTFERDLGAEEDQLRIPLRSLTPGQRVTLRILGEHQRRSDRSFSVPRLRPVNAVLQEGNMRVAVDRPLEVRAVEALGLRQTKLTEEGGQEIRSYEVLSNDCRLALHVGEPAAVLNGEILFIADVRGESPVSRVRVRLSTREGELFSPQMFVPQGWDLISVSLTEAADMTPAAWQVTEGPTGDRLLSLELRQPVRPDRDSILLMEFKAAALKPGAPRRLPIPRIRDAQNCIVRGVVWDHSPWELDVGSTGTIELDGTAADDVLIRAVNWTRKDDTQAVPTGIRISSFDTQSKPLFRVESSTEVDPETPERGVVVSKEAPLLCANLELETRTSRVGKSHSHVATFQFSHAATPGEFRVALPTEAELTRVIGDAHEISFVRRETEVVLDPAAQPVSELVLEYRTIAAPGWIVSRDEVVFPQLDCFVTEFAWHLKFDAERRLYRLPLTAAVSPREQPRPWERLLGPLARHSGETVFHPWLISDWRSLINGTPREGAATPLNEVWLVAPQIPERISLKTWNMDVSHGLAWCGFLGALVSGIGLRRTRSFWFRRGWIYFGGVCLVMAVFVAEPFAPIAGGAFLGSLLAIIVPRRFAIGRDWLADRSLRGPSAIERAAVVTGLLFAFSVNVFSPVSHGQDAIVRPEMAFFEVQEGVESAIYFDAAYRSQWDAWREQVAGPPWLLKSSRYEVQADASGPPRITATYEVAVFGDRPRAPLRLPLDGVSLDQVEGLIDGQPVRLIPAAGRHGFVLPLTPDKSEKPPAQALTAPESLRPSTVVMRTVTLKFRPLPNLIDDEQSSFTANIPPLPESVLALNSNRWRVASPTAEIQEPTEAARLFELGPVSRLDLLSGPPSKTPRENLTDVELRTLIESGPLGAKVQIGVLSTVFNPELPVEVTIEVPASLHIQSIAGPSFEQSRVEYRDSETLITLRLGPTQVVPSPVEITAFLPVLASGFQMPPPLWRPLIVKPLESLSTEPSLDVSPSKSLVGVVAKPGFTIIDTTPRASVTAISPQAFSDSLFSGIVWQVPDLAWNCRDASGPSWTLSSLVASRRAQLSQLITLNAPRSEWRLEATIDTAQGVPFEHTLTIDPRIEITRAIVQQDGADRLLRWNRTNDQVQLNIRDGQPGTQSIRIEGLIAQGSGAWLPPVCEYHSGQTTESSVMIRNSSRVTSTLKWADSTTRLRPNHGQSDEEVRYRPGTATAPLTIQVEPIEEQRSARVWVDLIPQRDNSWQVNLRAQLKESVPLIAPIRITWDQPGLTDFRLTNRRDQVRQTADNKAFLWRPQVQTSKPVELTISATISGETRDSHSIRLPQLSGVVWSDVWVSLPRGTGYRPARVSSTLLGSAPSDWPPSWSEGLTSTREDLYTCASGDISIESSLSDPLVRPVLAESLIWMDEAGDPAIAVRFGVTKYLLIAERDTPLVVPDSSREAIRAIAIDGRMQSADAPVRVTAISNDLSHELVIWWQIAASLPGPAPLDLIQFPSQVSFPHRVGVVPPHHQVLLDHWGRQDSQLNDFWLERSEALLHAANEFQGAPWSVDGPLFHHLSESREELSRAEGLSTGERARRDQILHQWTEFSRSGGSISAPIHDANGGLHDTGLDAVLSLCGESRSLWLSSKDLSPGWSGPRLLDRRWAIIITAVLASAVSLLVLIWVVRIFRRLDLAEKLAACPNATMSGLGLVWWACLSPSVLGLGLTLASGVLWMWDRVKAAREPTSPAANG